MCNVVSLQELAAWLATYGFCAFVSLERAGQFGSVSSLSNARSLADRGLAIWRSIQNDSPPGLAQHLSGDVAFIGYSMGGAAAVYTATRGRASDNIKFVAPLHPMVRF